MSLADCKNIASPISMTDYWYRGDEVNILNPKYTQKHSRSGERSGLEKLAKPMRPKNILTCPESFN